MGATLVARLPYAWRAQVANLRYERKGQTRCRVMLPGLIDNWQFTHRAALTRYLLQLRIAQPHVRIAGRKAPHLPVVGMHAEIPVAVLV